MDLDIRPYDGVGPLKLGMGIDAVRFALRSHVESFTKTPDSERPADAFDDLGMHVHYDRDGICEAIELASPAAPALHGRPLVGIPFSEVRDWLSSLDETLELEDEGLTASGLGIGVYAPDALEDSNAPVESVIVFRRNYYDAS